MNSEALWLSHSNTKSKIFHSQWLSINAFQGQNVEFIWKYKSEWKQKWEWAQKSSSKETKAGQLGREVLRGRNQLGCLINSCSVCPYCSCSLSSNSIHFTKWLNLIPDEPATFGRRHFILHICEELVLISLISLMVPAGIWPAVSSRTKL